MKIKSYNISLYDDRIWSFIGSFSLAIILVIIGNISIYKNLNLENEVVLYSLSAYVAANWGGMTEFYLTNKRFEECVSKYLFDFTVLVSLVLLVFILMRDPSVTLFSSLLLILYPASTFFYRMRSMGKFIYSAIFSLLLHAVLAFLLFYFKLPYYLLLVSAILIYLLTISASLMILKDISFKNIDWNFHKLGVINTLTGEVDRYILAAAMSPKISITYITITSTLGFVTMVTTSFIRLFINNYENFGKMPKIKPYLIMQLLSFPVVLIILPVLGHQYYVVFVLALGLLIKYVGVILTIPNFIEMYSKDQSKKLFRISFLVNFISIIISLLYLIVPSTALITSASKVLSSVPLYLLVFRGKNQ